MIINKLEIRSEININLGCIMNQFIGLSSVSFKIIRLIYLPMIVKSLVLGDCSLVMVGMFSDDWKCRVKSQT